MLTPRQHVQDRQGPVHVRFSKRRERRPGLRERHSAPHRVDKSEDENAKTETPRSAFVGHPHSGGISERYTLRVDQKRLPLGSKTVKNYEKVDEEFVSTQYKELTTIEAIRKQIATQPKLQTASPTLPDWLLNLDLNLDVTAVDIIPPFDSCKQKKSDTYRSEPKVTIIHEDDYNNNVSRTETSADGECYSYNDVRENHEEKYREVDTRQVASRQSNYSSYGRTSKGPRRYQGDMRVMSLQTGGIRSTPFQPKAKKFINQMITYHHMKLHNKKLKTVKPAVDARMPSSFHIALERKKLVEERLSESWNSTYQSSTPRRTITPSSQKDKQGKLSS